MAIRQINKFQFNDMIAEYVLDEEAGIPELMLYPAGLQPNSWNCKKQNADGLIQLKILGDNYTGSYSGGVSMRQSDSVSHMKFDKQEVSILQRTAGSRLFAETKGDIRGSITCCGIKRQTRFRFMWSFIMKVKTP